MICRRTLVYNKAETNGKYYISYYNAVMRPEVTAQNACELRKSTMAMTYQPDDYSAVDMFINRLHQTALNLGVAGIRYANTQTWIISKGEFVDSKISINRVAYYIVVNQHNYGILVYCIRYSAVEFILDHADLNQHWTNGQ
jgi:hypothetical protein